MYSREHYNTEGKFSRRVPFVGIGVAYEHSAALNKQTNG